MCASAGPWLASRCWPSWRIREWTQKHRCCIQNLLSVILSPPWKWITALYLLLFLIFLRTHYRVSHGSKTVFLPHQHHTRVLPSLFTACCLLCDRWLIAVHFAGAGDESQGRAHSVCTLNHWAALSAPVYYLDLGPKWLCQVFLGIFGNIFLRWINV